MTDFLTDIEFIESIKKRKIIYSQELNCYYCGKLDTSDKVETHIKLKIPASKVEIKMNNNSFNFHELESEVFATKVHYIHVDCVDKLRALMRLHKS